jgi:large subunit ribosomal protein L5
VADQDNIVNNGAEQAETPAEAPAEPTAEVTAEAPAKARGQNQGQKQSQARGETRAESQPKGQAQGGKDGKGAKGGNGAKPEAGVPDNWVPPLKTRYLEEVVPAMLKEFNYSNRMQVPSVKKVVINIGMGTEARENAKSLDNAVNDVGQITGQKAVITRAKKSIAAFKLRTGMPIGVMVTLRGNRMYDFLDKLFNITLPRVRDFSGVSPRSFDGHGNFTLGLREQLIFPEIDYDSIDKIRGMEVVIVTSAPTDEEGRRLLQLMGMPFKRG